MFFTTALLAALVPVALAAPAEGATYKIPFMGNGAFVATVDAAGNVNATRLPDPPATAKRDGRLMARYPPLPVSRHECMAIHSNHYNYDRAKLEFGLQCDQGNPIPAGGILYSVEGDSVAFGCSWAGTNPCSTAEYLWYVDYMFNKCGAYRGGYVDMSDWKKQYGMQLKGEITCGHWIGA